LKKTIDVINWARKEHFEFFNTFDEPFFGITSEVDCTRLYQKAKEQQQSFFIHYLYACTKALNLVDELHYRVEDGTVVRYEDIHVSSTVGRKDGSFGFTFVHFTEDFDAFYKETIQEIEAVENSKGLRFNENAQRIDTIHFSPLPWINFTSIQHARNFQFPDSVPKICVGKFTTKNNYKIIPVSLHAHHGLADGYHAGLFFEKLQELMYK
jgi:chloramphenicol O-acetyltransferase type A